MLNKAPIDHGTAVRFLFDLRKPCKLRAAWTGVRCTVLWHGARPDTECRRRIEASISHVLLHRRSDGRRPFGLLNLILS